MGKRIDNIDYIRIVAAACIVLHHYQQSYGVHFENGLNFNGGSIYFEGFVDLFFIISGFLAARGNAVHGRENSVKKLIHKIIRIYPGAILSVFLCCLFYWTGYFAGVWPRPGYEPIQYIASFLLIHDGWLQTIAPAINNPTWYLCVLIVMYIEFYVIEKISLKFIRIVVYVVLSLTGLIWFQLWDMPFLSYNSCRGYLFFFAGVLLFNVAEHLGKEGDLKFSVIIIVSAIVLGVVGKLVLTDFLAKTTTSISQCLLYSGILIFAKNFRQFPSRFGRLLGASSFCVYLLHTPIFILAKLVFDIAGVEIRHTYLSMVLMLAVVEAIGVMVYLYYEVPIGKILNKAETRVCQINK